MIKRKFQSVIKRIPPTTLYLKKLRYRFQLLKTIKMSDMTDNNSHSTVLR